MMLVVVCCWLLMCQTSSVRPDGITLPITSIVYKSSPIDKKPLSVSFTPNACNEKPTTYTSGSRSIESVNIPTKLPQESCSVQEPQPPFNTVSISTPLNPALDKPLQIQSFTANAFTPKTLAFPQIDLSSLESSHVVNNKMIDGTRELVPPVVQYSPNYVITSTDNSNNKIKFPLVPVMLDNLPSNIHKVKIADSKPIFIDCSKSSKSYQIPTNLASVNPYVIQNVANPVPKYEVVQDTIADYRLNLAREDYMISQASAVFVENPVTFFNPNNNVIQQQLINKATTEPKSTNYIEISASTGKVEYPIRNVIFSYGSNSCNQFQTASTQKTQPCSIIPPKVAPVDNKIELTQIVNAIPPQINNQSPENMYCYCNKINIIPKPESVCYCTGLPTSSSTSCLINPAYTRDNELPTLPVSQLPNVNTINKPSLRSSTLPCSIPTSASSYDATSDTFTSQLSCSLNSIISLLTAGLISTVFGNTTPELIPDIVPIEITYEPIKEPAIDIPTTFMNTDTFVSNPSNSSCPPSLIDIPVILPKPEIDLTLKDFDSHECLRTPSAVCTQEAPKCKPYLASITINIMPSLETTNDIIIVI
ncbi:uncharacterized protein LOC135194247 [Vanessa tameamea]|uniref:Uncharacterized protein LOC135194247 n=1 Tax=Vanessa tameamea TaxID=334116 RepID=A0ABM4AWA0_VANTA